MFFILSLLKIYTMDLMTIHFSQYLWLLFIIQTYLAVRYALKAVMKQVHYYNFFNLAIVLLVPIVGYFWVMHEENKKQQAESDHD
jgi:hypothetical protein